jgi:membrane associated rhomboid family serine protease
MVLTVGFAVSLLPDISMAGHIGGIIGGVAVAFFIKRPKR